MSDEAGATVSAGEILSREEIHALLHGFDSNALTTEPATASDAVLPLDLRTQKGTARACP
jgi:flagellar motor switch protein FliM